MKVLLSVLCSVCPILVFALPTQLSLNGSWSLSSGSLKVSAKVPGMVQQDLLRAGVIAEPFAGANYKSQQWVGEKPWLYARSFEVPASLLSKRFIRLRCEGLDTVGTVRLNGQTVSSVDNMFRTWEFDAKPFLHAGSNRIEIQFEPLDSYLVAQEHKLPFEFKPNQASGWEYVRKAPYQQGWDFAPKLVTVGIWKNIGLVAWDQARVSDYQITQTHTSGKVRLHVALAAEAGFSGSVISTVTFKGVKVASVKSAFVGGKSSADIDVVHPQLWWPAGMGEQNLYRVHSQLVDGRGVVCDEAERRIGLRTITWFPKTAHSPLGIAVNGRRFFARGSNWVPSDVIFSRESAAKERRLVQLAADAHMNLLRLWGGGHYENDAFYDACDEKGVLVWFEFKFADAAYPIFDAAWRQNVQAEAEDNVRRVRSHPCLAIYSGNNECIGFIADKTDTGHMSHEDYNLLFHTLLADVVHKLDPGAEYTPGSPEVGDDHYWDVWHGGAGFDSYRKLHGFMSEFGFQAFPAPLTVQEFTQPADRSSVLSAVMETHQKNWRDGNLLIENRMLKSYRKPKDFESELWLSQIQQAAGILEGVEHWRQDWPNSTGSLVWQFNDSWPATSWSMIDYNVRPKALYYALKRAYAPVALSAVADPSGKADVWIVNDRPVAKRGVLTWRLLTVDGAIAWQQQKPVSVPAGTSSAKVATLDLSEQVAKFGADNVMLELRLDMDGEDVAPQMVPFVNLKSLQLEDPKFRYTIWKLVDGYQINLMASNPAPWVWVDLKGIDASFSDDFFSLSPGNEVFIKVHTFQKVSEAQFKKALHIRSVFDTYVPGDPGEPTIAVSADGSLLATATTADVVGNSADVERGKPDNIGFWTDPKDYLRWKIKQMPKGVYRVVANVAIPQNEQGSTFAIELDGHRVEGKVPGTKSWYDYTDLDMGTISVDHTATMDLVLRPEKMVGEHVMNLRSVKLIPVGDRR